MTWELRRPGGKQNGWRNPKVRGFFDCLIAYLDAKCPAGGCFAMRYP